MLLCTAFSACSKFSSKPIVKVSDPFQHIRFSAGQSFDVKAKFTDNKALASYHVCVSDAAGNPYSDFNVEDAGTLSGKEYTYNRSVQTPASANGTYYLHFVVVDSDGKEKEVYHEFHVDQ